MMIRILGIFALSILAFRILRFATTPLLKKLGFYKYYSPMFMSMPWFFNTYDLHLGTSWDFAKMVDIHPKKILEYIAEGLIKIAHEIEKGSIKPRSLFKGNTFYLKNDTIKKFGFNTRKMNLLESILFVLNYLELCMLNSIIKKKLYFIPIKNVMIVTFGTEEVLRNKEKFESTLNTLRRRENRNTVKPQVKLIREFKTDSPSKEIKEHFKATVTGMMS